MADSNWAEDILAMKSILVGHESRIAALENGGTCPPPAGPNIFHETCFDEHTLGTSWGETGQWNKIRSYHPGNNDQQRRYGNPGLFDASVLVD